MNNQYNPQQPTPQQTTAQQPQAPQPTPIQTQQQYPQQSGQQFQQPYQQPYAPKPPKPYVDPAVANKQKQDAINAFGDKLTDLMNTNPILKIIAQYADLISYAATGVCVLFTLIALIASNLNLIAFTFNLGGEIGGCFIFPVLAVIFGGFSLCKKNMLPLTVSMTAISCLMLTRTIVNIVSLATIGDIASKLGLSYLKVSAPGGIVINFIFMIIELAAVGCLTYICWTYFLATLPSRPVMQQPYQQPYNPQQNNMQQASYQQPVTPVQPVAVQQSVAPEQPAAPVPSPEQNAVPAQTAAVSTENVFCHSCGAVNNSNSSFCSKCGTKLKNT